MDGRKDEGPGWGWVPAAMPGVARLVRDRRAKHGDAWVNHCWRKSVIERQPGYFFAREGPIAIGTPWPEIADVAGWNVTATQAIVLMREPEAERGANP